MKKIIAVITLFILPSFALADTGVIDTLTIGTSSDSQYNGVITMRGCTGQVGNSSTCLSSSICGGPIYFDSKSPMAYSTLTAVKLSQHIVTINYGMDTPGHCVLGDITVGGAINTPSLSSLSTPQLCTSSPCTDNLVLLNRYTVHTGSLNFTLMNYTAADVLGLSSPTLATGGRSQRCPNGIDTVYDYTLHSLLLNNIINMLTLPSITFSYDTNDNSCALVSYQKNF